MWTVCRSVGPSFANPHNISLAYRLQLHFDPFAIPPRVAKFCAFGCQEYIKCIHNTWRAKMAKNIWTVCHKVFKPFAIRYLNRLPQDIWTVCHKTFIPFAYTSRAWDAFWSLSLAFAHVDHGNGLKSNREMLAKTSRFRSFVVEQCIPNPWRKLVTGIHFLHVHFRTLRMISL